MYFLMKANKDTIFQEPMESVEPFAFGSEVAGVFDDMILRSVPLYEETQRLSAQVVCKFWHKGSAFYDLGCATGKSIIAAAQAISNQEFLAIGIDSSVPMLEKCRENIKNAKILGQIQLINHELESIQLNKASVVALNYTLQFIDPERRPAILEKIAQGLTKGGALILSEKILDENVEVDLLLRELHEEFKEKNSYTKLEIAQKREALKNVLRPLPLEKNIQMLLSAGFSKCSLVLRLYNFCTIVAIR